jgi:hypothetical protein
LNSVILLSESHKSAFNNKSQSLGNGARVHTYSLSSRRSLYFLGTGSYIRLPKSSGDTIRAPPREILLPRLPAADNTRRRLAQDPQHKTTFLRRSEPTALPAAVNTRPQGSQYPSYGERNRRLPGRGTHKATTHSPSTRLDSSKFHRRCF